MSTVDASGRHSLHYAAAAGNAVAVQHLLEWDGEALLGGDSGTTPLHLAAYNGHKDALVIMLAQTQDGVDRVDSEGRSPLHLAAHTGQAACIELLLDRGSHVTQQDPRGRTPVHCAAAQVQTFKQLQSCYALPKSRVTLRVYVCCLKAQRRPRL